MRKTGFVQLCAVGLLSLSTVPAFAQTAPASSAVDDARAILIANNTEKTLDAMFTQLVPVMESGFIGQLSQIEGGTDLIAKIEANYPGGQAAFAKRFGDLLMVGLRSEYTNIIEQAAQQFVTEIKPADLAAIRAFMESSAGQSMTAAQPKMQEKLSMAGQEIGRKAGEGAAIQLMDEAGKYFGKAK